MSTLARRSAAPNGASPPNDAVALSRLEARLPPVLSVIAGMVDLTGFLPWDMFSLLTSPATLW